MKFIQILIRIFRAFFHDFRGAWKQAKALFAYHLGQGYAAPPTSVALHVTRRCNLRCRMCWWWGDQGLVPNGQELTFEDIGVLVNKVAPLKPTFYIGGGEPLMRKDICDIVKLVHSYRMPIELLSNGTMITPKIAACLIENVGSLVFSLDGPEQIHDLIRGEGAFQKTLNGIEMVREAARETKSKTVTRLNLTISAINSEYLDSTIGIANQAGCEISFSHLNYSEPAMTSQEGVVSEGEVGIENTLFPNLNNGLYGVNPNLLQQKISICTRLAKNMGVRFYVFPELAGPSEVKRWYTSSENISAMHCSYPWTTLFINPDGEVNPCEFIDYPLGNILSADVGDIWNGEKMRRFRRSLKKHRFNTCTRCCKLTKAGLLL